MQNSEIPKQMFGKLWYCSAAGPTVSKSEFGVEV